MHLYVLLRLVCFSIICIYVVEPNKTREYDIAFQLLRRLRSLNEKATKLLTRMIDYEAFFNDHLHDILRARVPDTKSHDDVKQFIVSKLKGYGWKVELDKFIDDTPLGPKTFTNIIATLYPNATRRLALAAHYDTKIIPPENGEPYIGASDSAVSCAMLLQFAKLFSDATEGQNDIPVDVSPMLIFTDGEEAFVKWTDDDSLYGSRHLAQKMSLQPHHKKRLAAQGKNMLDSLEAFVLFDLIGTSQGGFLDMYSETTHLYKHLRKVETKLQRLGQINRSYSYFYGKHSYSVDGDDIDDDHIPFLERGVPILHLISLPYPKQWHKVSDNKSALHEDTIVDLLRIFGQFLLEYFNISKQN